jgi:hypothetical protein
MRYKWAGVLLACASMTALATPGAVDSKGCHASTKIGFHCHPQRADKVGGLPGGESQAQRDKRLRRECKGMQNAGACTGYAKR